MKLTKKLLATLLALALVITCLMPAFSVAAENYTVPIRNDGKRVVVMLSGDGDALYDKDGNRLFKFTDMLGRLDNKDDDDNSELYKSVANVLMPFLREGLLLNNWDPYYENLQKEVSELTDGLQLDENGDVVNGSGLSPDHKAVNEDNMTHDNYLRDGKYDSDTYHFWYDWRKDPLETADELRAYLEAVREVTGQNEVSLLGRCLGNNVIAAYIHKYGLEWIRGVGIDGTVSNGAEFISESISGKFHVDGRAIERLLVDSSSTGRLKLNPFVLATLDLAVESGLIDSVVGVTKATLYKRLVEGVTSALALATFFTMPCYWACVKPADFEDAKNYVFGPEGGEKRQKYAGLIAKIDNYQHTVRDHMDEILRSIPESGKKIAVISKYGFQIVPICQSSDCVSDQYASVASSSFGATTSTIFTRLPEDYIAKQEADGKGKYISPDRMIDASTCLFPDYTWFTKNITHSLWSWTENALLYTVITADTQYTADDLNTTRFVVREEESGRVVPMTAENCNTEHWEVEPEPEGISKYFLRFQRFFESLTNWFRSFITFVKEKLNK